MKQLLCMFLLLGSFLISKSQTLNYLGKVDRALSKIDTINLNLSTEVQTVNFKLKDRKPGSEIIIEIKDQDTGTANLNKDYIYEPFSLNTKIVNDNTSQVFNIDMKINNTKPGNAILYISVIGQTTKLYKVIVTFNGKTDNDTKPKVENDSTSNIKLFIVTGGSFDFFESPKFKNFAGDLNLFASDLFEIPLSKKSNSEVKIGLQFGIFNFHYFESDSSGRNPSTTQYYLNPQDRFSIRDTISIIRKTTTLGSTTDYNIWGAYINPVVLLKSGVNIKLYANFHAEALYTTEKTEYKAKIVNSTTFKLTPVQIQEMTLEDFEPAAIKYTRNTFHDYYIGIGLPIRIEVPKAFRFNITPTYGRALIQTLPIDVLQDQYTRRGSNSGKRDNQEFFLTKFQLITQLAPVDIALGGEYRAVVNRMHYFSLYIGAALALDKLKR